MGFPGVWMTESRNLIYRVVPKCACSTVGQIMYYTDHGHYYEGDIHDAQQGLHKWALEDSRQPISDAITDHSAFAFTVVRNPYSRILSSFFDKIAGIQRNGQRYRSNMVPMLTQKYGIDVEGDFDQIAMFRRFLLFARDTIRFRKPMDPDIHWSSTSGHVSTFIHGGGRYDAILRTEDFNDGMADVLSKIKVANKVDLGNVPRFNESADHGPKRAFPVEDYFDDLAQHLVYEIYKRDFRVFGYSTDPANRRPKKDIDLEEVHAKLGR